MMSGSSRFCLLSLNSRLLESYIFQAVTLTHAGQSRGTGSGEGGCDRDTREQRRGRHDVTREILEERDNRMDRQKG